MPPHEFRSLIPGQVWLISTSFWMFGYIPLNNNGLIIRTLKTDGNPTLIAANAPELNSDLVKDLKSLENEQGAKIEYVLGTDFHHLHAKEWAKNFAGSTVLFPSQRPGRFYEKEPFTWQALDQQEPQIPNVDPTKIQLLPVHGFNAPKASRPDERRRGDYNVYLPEHKLLFMFDLLVPLLPWRRFLFMKTNPSQMSLPYINFAKGSRGYQIDDEAQCSNTAQKLLDLDIQTLVFSHGDIDCGAVRTGPEQVKPAMDLLRSLLKPSN